MMQARQLLESHVAEFAATQATKKDIIKMREALELEKKSIDESGNNHVADKLFHLAIAEATQNSVLVDLVKNLWDRRENSPMWKQLHIHITDQAYRKKWLVDHENILLAIQQKKAGPARLAMWQHLENVKDTLMELSEHQSAHFDGYLFSTNPVQLKDRRSPLKCDLLSTRHSIKIYISLYRFRIYASCHRAFYEAVLGHPLCP